MDMGSDEATWAVLDAASVAQGYNEYVRVAEVLNVVGALAAERDEIPVPPRTDLPLSL